jgi:hypothetical protein
MKTETLKRFEPLYLQPRYMGAGDVLRRHLGVGGDYVVPLGLSHGVDFGQVPPCMDVGTVEPLHWAHNHTILEAARPFKPAVAVPHPFLLAMQGQAIPAGEGTLVVGPPPGPENDRRLAELLSAAEFTGATILIKPKRNSHLSAAFWRGRGFRTTSISDGAPADYVRMLETFRRYERVVGCTFSSVLIFAAALGKRVELIRGYRYRAYEVADHEATFSAESPPARALVRTFAQGSHSEVTAMAIELLGGGLDAPPERIRHDLEEAVERLAEPLHFATRYPRPLRKVLAEAALWLGRPGLVGRRFSDVLTDLRTRRVCIQEVDEIALWLDGPSPGNPRYEPCAYTGPATTPGDAVEAY